MYFGKKKKLNYYFAIGKIILRNDLLPYSVDLNVFQSDESPTDTVVKARVINVTKIHFLEMFGVIANMVIALTYNLLVVFAKACRLFKNFYFLINIYI